MSQNPFAGTWTYRGFLNDPTAYEDCNQLKVGFGELVIDDTPIGQISGRLRIRANYEFRLHGYCTLGNPCTIRFQGVGDAPDALGQKYDYLGCLSPIWPNGRGQRLAIVGTIVVKKD